MPPAAAIVGAGVLAAGATVGSSAIQSDAADSANTAQLQATLESIKAQRELTERGFQVFQSQTERAQDFLREQNALARGESRRAYERAIDTLQPFQDVALQNLKAAQGYADPDSPQSKAERAVFQRNLAQNLAARGLTGSGTEIQGLTDYEVGQGANRRNLVLGLANLGTSQVGNLANLYAANNNAGLSTQLGQGLAGLASNLGSVGSSLFGNLGQNIGGTLAQGGQTQAGLALQSGQAQAQGLAGLGNVAQGVLGNYLSLQQQNQNQQFLQSILNPQRGGGAGVGQIGSNAYDYINLR